MNLQIINKAIKKDYDYLYSNKFPFKFDIKILDTNIECFQNKNWDYGLYIGVLIHYSETQKFFLGISPNMLNSAYEINTPLLDISEEMFEILDDINYQFLINMLLKVEQKKEININHLIYSKLNYLLFNSNKLLFSHSYNSFIDIAMTVITYNNIHKLSNKSFYLNYPYRNLRFILELSIEIDKYFNLKINKKHFLFFIYKYLTKNIDFKDWNISLFPDLRHHYFKKFFFMKD